MTGDLTLRGVTHEVVLDVDGPTAAVKDLDGQMRAGAAMTTTINRKHVGPEVQRARSRPEEPSSPTKSRSRSISSSRTSKGGFMSRVFAVVFVVAAAAAIHQTGVGANGSAVSVGSLRRASSSMPVITPEQIAANAYNSGIAHKNKGLKLEADAAKATKDRDKILGKAKDEYGKALKDFKKALRDLKPDAYQAFNGMGFALRKTGEPVKALEMYDKALQPRAGIPRRDRVSRRSLSRAQPG